MNISNLLKVALFGFFFTVSGLFATQYTFKDGWREKTMTEEQLNAIQGIRTYRLDHDKKVVVVTTEVVPGSFVTKYIPFTTEKKPRLPGGRLCDTDTTFYFKNEVLDFSPGWSKWRQYTPEDRIKGEQQGLSFEITTEEGTDFFNIISRDGKVLSKYKILNPRDLGLGRRNDREQTND